MTIPASVPYPTLVLATARLLPSSRLVHFVLKARRVVLCDGEVPQPWWYPSPGVLPVQCLLALWCPYLCLSPEPRLPRMLVRETEGLCSHTGALLACSEVGGGQASAFFELHLVSELVCIQGRGFHVPLQRRSFCPGPCMLAGCLLSFTNPSPC